MRVLLLGSGGRESALARALARSRVVTSLLAAPGNPGIAGFAEVAPVELTSPRAVVELAGSFGADLVVVGPEAPLVAGVGDALRAAGRAVFGPDRSAAMIEGSKSYAKRLMEVAGVPTARWRRFERVEPAMAFLSELGPPYVVKADGLAAGKGVVVTSDLDEARAALEDRLVKGVFGEAGTAVVIEEHLAGPEVSVIAVCDGRTALVCEPAQDYKRAFDGDIGPNTGGMGAYSPVPVCPPELTSRVGREIIEPMLAAAASVGSPFVGALYAGLVLTDRGPRVLEFNVRFGDPETQALIPRLRTDFGEVAAAAARGELAGGRLQWSEQACVTVVLASGGYPGPHDTGLEITGLEEAAAVPGVELFHAGTARRDGALVTAGGRVLAVSALGRDFAEARERAYAAAEKVTFEGKHYRSDIALAAVEANA